MNNLEKKRLLREKIENLSKEYKALEYADNESYQSAIYKKAKSMKEDLTQFCKKIGDQEESFYFRPTPIKEIFGIIFKELEDIIRWRKPQSNKQS